MTAVLRAGMAVAATATALAACGDDPTGVVFEVIEDVTFDASLGVDLSQMTKLPSGVYILDDPAGTGAVIASGDSLSVDHMGWLRNGNAFSSGEFAFRYDANPRRLIDGFEVGMAGMAVGGTRRLVIPPELAYGEQGARDQVGNVVIPGGAVVVFEVELLAIIP